MPLRGSGKTAHRRPIRCGHSGAQAGPEPGKSFEICSLGYREFDVALLGVGYEVRQTQWGHAGRRPTRRDRLPRPCHDRNRHPQSIEGRHSSRMRERIKGDVDRVVGSKVGYAVRSRHQRRHGGCASGQRPWQTGWLLNRFDTCRRWLQNRDDTPWCPSLRQFRQPTPCGLAERDQPRAGRFAASR
jgi:hypothetical protein